jgi:hypothetical protein
MGQILLAQEEEKKEKKESFQFEKYSFQFMITSNFNLNPFQGSLLSFKYHLNNNHAIRFGLGLGNRGWSSEDIEEYYGTDSSYVSIESDRRSNDFDITTQWLYYVKPQKVIKLFLGAGPMIFYNLNKTETQNIDTLYQAQGYIYDYRVDNKRYGLGISTVYGVEWFFHKQMSLLGEYGFEFYYHQNIIETERIRLQPGMADITEKRKVKENGWVFYSSSVKLGLSVYF